ncbi:molybdopterin-dependent oxidoreductase [Desulfogranum japonicum]|uniref:molybdopterin-dependent oxidoreductase n=1 Tax=Desulfogranum japonicum TaxID=231447 RepID=UPI000A05F0D3|nr:molybdopterin-dependent oxidoreductase [Desulfogranum japonicum]
MQRPYNDNQSYHLQICGKVATELQLSMYDLRELDQFEANQLPLRCGSGEPKGCSLSGKGVLLTDVINLADVIAAGHNDTKKMFIIARSDDGYTTVFSWQELFNTVVGEGVLILLEKDGVPLYGGHGPADLISGRDFLSGPRYVKRLARIEIVLLDEFI